MVVTKMKKIKFQCRKCDCWSLICGIKKNNKKKKKGNINQYIHLQRGLKSKKMIKIIKIIAK